LRKYIYKKST